MQFTELLTKHGLTEETVSHGLKVKIKRYNSFVNEIEKEKVKLAQAKTPKSKIASEGEIKRGEEYLVTLNDEICNGVENYAANKELNIRKAENLKKARESKGKPKEKPVVDPVEEAVNPEEKENEPEEKPKEEVIETEVIPALPETKKKKSNIWGWVLGITLVVVTAGAVGYKYFKDKE